MNTSSKPVPFVHEYAAPLVSLHMRNDDNVSITCFEKNVPPFIGKHLDRLYGSLFSSLAHFNVYGGAEQVNTYVACHGEVILSALLFNLDKNKVRVINEGITLEDTEISRFVRYIFHTYERVNIVIFHAVESRFGRLPYPIQKYPCTEDSVLTLPATIEAYLERLGKATRKNIKRYLGRLKENFPSFSYRTYTKEEIDEQQVLAIIQLNRTRMANKNKISGIDDDEARRLIALSRTNGMLAVITINGEICAGAITYRIGDNYFSMVRAHDPRYDDHRLGLIGGYLLVAECIARGGKELHFMWGREKHKSMLLGSHKNLDHIAVYRSLTHAVTHPNIVLKNILANYERRIRLWIQEAQNQNHWIWQYGFSLLRKVYRSRLPKASRQLTDRN